MRNKSILYFHEDGEEMYTSKRKLSLDFKEAKPTEEELKLYFKKHSFNGHDQYCQDVKKEESHQWQ